MICSPYSLLRSLRVCRHYMRYTSVIANMKFLDPPLGVYTFETMSTWDNIEALLLVFVWQRYLGLTINMSTYSSVSSLTLRTKTVQLGLEIKQRTRELKAGWAKRNWESSYIAMKWALQVVSVGLLRIAIIKKCKHNNKTFSFEHWKTVHVARNNLAFQ